MRHDPTPPPASGKQSNLFPETDFDSSTDFLEYTNRAAAVLRTLGLELHFDSTVARARMGGIAPVVPGPNVRARARAKHVNAPLFKAVEAIVVAAEHVAEAQRRFTKVYAEELDAAGNPHRDRGPKPMRMEG